MILALSAASDQTDRDTKTISLKEFEDMLAVGAALCCGRRLGARLTHSAPGEQSYKLFDHDLSRRAAVQAFAFSQEASLNDGARCAASQARTS
jgi:hypothetical protein